MRILYLAFVRLPTEKAHGAQIMKTCEALADCGINVELLIPGRGNNLKEDPFAYYDVRRNFTLTALMTPDLVSWGALGFVLSMLCFGEAARWRKSFAETDIIYSRDALLLLCYLLLGKQLVYEAHTRPTLLSIFVAKRVAKLIVISEGLRDAYRTAGVPSEKITVAHDAIDSAAFQKRYDIRESRERLGIPIDKKIAMYVGRLARGKGVDTFVAASESVPSDMECVLIGSGPLETTLKQGHPNVRVLPETPYRDLGRVLAAADVLILPNSSRDADAALYASPLKAFAYLASGKPILASDVPSLRAILGQAPSVIFLSPDDPDALARALHSIQLPQDPVSRNVYSWNDRAKRLIQSLQRPD